MVEEIKKAIFSLGEILKESQAIGICGSIARGDFSDRSDIDIFVVVREKNTDTDKVWYERITNVLEEFKRGVTVIVYSIKGLKEICNWYVLRLASEGILIFDQGNIKELFKKIIDAAKEAGMVEEKIGSHRYWKFKDIELGEVKEVVVK